MTYNDTVKVAIIGAGVGGICLALDLQDRGLYDYTIYEAEDGIGGTWYQNNYPGCRCDIAAIWYSHSRYLNPDWTETHPLRPEIVKYWQDLATTQGVDRHVKLRHRYISAEWDAKAGEYTITTRNGETGELVISKANVLVSAIGGFHTPLFPKLKGQDAFRGRVIHCARWPKDVAPKDLRGKKVAVIGNGCSGVQVIGALSEDPEIELYAVARSAHWYLPARHGGTRNSVPYSPTIRAAYRNFPILQRISRNATYLRNEMVWPVFKLSNAWLRNRFQARLEAWMRKEMPKEIVDVAIPNFPAGSKRFVFEDGYFTALKRKNVTPIWGSLSGFTETGIVLDNEQVVDVDYVVLSTGFDVEDAGLDVVGTTSKTKDFKARSELRAYHGMAIPGMPNYFTMLGTFSATGHASIAFILEVQANYIVQCIQAIKDQRIKALEVKRTAMEKWHKAISDRAEKTVWSQAKSYIRSNGGDGKVWTHYPGFVAEIWWTNRTPEWSDYTGAEGLARRQKARRWLRRAVLTAALIVAAQYTVPPHILAAVGSATTDAAATVGVPASWVSGAAGAINGAVDIVDSVAGAVKSFLPW